MNIEICGDKILNEDDFHNEIARQLNVEGYYGKNLDALWDLFSVNVKRPLNLTWYHSEFSKNNLEPFENILRILERVKEQDEIFNWKEKFTYELIP